MPFTFARLQNQYTIFVIVRTGTGGTNRYIVMIKKCMTVAMAMSVLNLSLFAGTPLVRGTQIPVRLTSDVTSRSGDTPTAVVEKDVLSRDGQVLIKQGTPVETQLERQKARGCGRPGSLSLKMVATKSVDGQRIVLEGTNEREGLNKKGQVIGLGVGLGVFIWPCLFILCKKGGEAKVPVNTTLSNISVAFDYDIAK